MCETLFLAGAGGWGWMGHYFGWLGEGGKTFWVNGGEWGLVGVSENGCIVP